MDFQTPPEVCNYMAGILDKYDDLYTILEPTPGGGNLVEALKLKNYPVTVPPIDLDFFDFPSDSRFHAIVMNPPFTPMKRGYDILYKCMEMSDIIIALMPWLTLINSKKRTKDIYNFGLASVTHLPRDVFLGSRVQTCILEMDRDHEGKTELKFYSK